MHIVEHALIFLPNFKVLITNTNKSKAKLINARMKLE